MRSTVQRNPRFVVYGVLLVVLSAVLVWQRSTDPQPAGGNALSPAPPVPHCDAHDGERLCVLFVGNSMTYGNDLPGMFEQLAQSAGHEVQAEMVAMGGATLGDHAASVASKRAIGESRWGVVVLQEQSQVPSVEADRQEMMYPAARFLVERVRAARSQPLFYLTAARAAGDPERGQDSYDEMQAAVAEGYRRIGTELRVPVAPAGVAWSRALDGKVEPSLWSGDGVHPSVSGTYLVACAFYASIFGRSPSGLSYEAGLPPSTARRLQAVAGQVVLSSPADWVLPRRVAQRLPGSRSQPG